MSQSCRNLVPFFLLVILNLSITMPGCAQNVDPRPLLVGYFGQWGLYNDPQYTLKDLAANNKAGMLNQLNYAQAFVTGGHCSIADPNADLNYTFTAVNSVNGQADDPSTPFRGHLHQLAELKDAYPHLKVLISLEGRASDFAFDAQPEHRQAFIASCVDIFIKGRLNPDIVAQGLFDGIDIDWEYPQGADAANFLALLTEFRRQMNSVRPGLKLTIAVGPSPGMYDAIDFAAVAAQVDTIGLMTYDFAGPWMQTTGFVGPLYNVPQPLGQSDPPSSPAATPTLIGNTAATKTAVQTSNQLLSATPSHERPAGGAAGSAQAFLNAGVPADKILIGVPFYGYGWTQVPEVANGVFQEGTPVRGDRPYSYIQSLMAHSTVYRDPVSQTPWLFDGDAFWTFDDPISIQAKATYALEHNLGGLMIWELSGDTSKAVLLTAAHQILAQQSQKAMVQ